IRDNYFYGSQSKGSEGYGVETDIAADNLIENNIEDNIPDAHTQGVASVGNVFAYNYELHDGYTLGTTPPSNWAQPQSNMHGNGSSYLLFEGNQGEGIQGDGYWGPAEFVTSFRERNTGFDTGKSSNTMAVMVAALNRYWNIIGDVLGQPGYHTTYQS